MKERVVLLFCLVVFLSACAPVGVLVQPTPTSTKTPRPVSTPTPTPSFPFLVLELLEYNEKERVATIRVYFGPAVGTYKLEKGQEATLEAIGCKACKIVGVRVWLRLNPVTNRLEYRMKEESEWRVPSKHEPLQL